MYFVGFITVAWMRTWICPMMSAPVGTRGNGSFEAFKSLARLAPCSFPLDMASWAWPRAVAAAKGHQQKKSVGFQTHQKIEPDRVDDWRTSSSFPGNRRQTSLRLSDSKESNSSTVPRTSERAIACVSSFEYEGLLFVPFIRSYSKVVV